MFESPAGVLAIFAKRRRTCSKEVKYLQAEASLYIEPGERKVDEWLHLYDLQPIKRFLPEKQRVD